MADASDYREHHSYDGDFDDESGYTATPACPMCGGPGKILGVLGKRTHFRCHHCGMDYSRGQGDQ